MATLKLAALHLLAFSTTTSKRVVDNIVTNPRGTPSFSVDYGNGTFLLDGEPFRYISGSVHYFRIHPSQWKDRLERVRALGFNAIQYYIPWNFHELEREQISFDGWRDFPRFSRIAADLGMFTILRIGPYICAEWENGGLPWWLIRDNKDIKMRTNDTRFTAEVSRWFTALAPIVRPLLRQNGGPILMVQIENEYGQFAACDRDYNIFLRDETRRLLGKDTMLFTTDPIDALKCGPIPEVLTTIDFGPASSEKIDEYFALQKQHLPGGKGPLVNSEFYSGWFVQWGQKEQKLPTVKETLKSAQYIVEKGGNVNFYMIHGGTNYDFWTGAEESGAVITSYDYTSPISEDGSYTDLYWALRDWITAIPGWTNTPTSPPKAPRKQIYSDIQMHLIAPLGSVRGQHDLGKRRPSTPRGRSRLVEPACTTSKQPQTFEELQHPYGYVQYFHVLQKCGKTLRIDKLSDFGYVRIGHTVQDTFIKNYQGKKVTEIQLKNCTAGQKLQILVENQGRQNYPTINDHKGILSPVLLDGEVLEDWEQCGVRVNTEASSSSFLRIANEDRHHRLRTGTDHYYSGMTGMYMGVFHTETISDTFLQMDNWGKGFVVVNNQNIGRYWTAQGPQHTLYIPAALLRPKGNLIIIIEVDGPIRNCTTTTCPLSFTDKLDIHFGNNTSISR